MYTDATDFPAVAHIVFDGDDDTPTRSRTRIATLDELHEARAQVQREIDAVEAERDPFVVQGFLYNDWRVASVARAKIQTALMNRADLIDTAIAHASAGIQ